jgi:hypothetical protein
MNEEKKQETVEYCEIHHLPEPCVQCAKEHEGYNTHPQPKREPVAWKETHGKVIKALAGIVTVHTPDNLFDLDAIPREPVMSFVQDIKAALDKYKPPQPKREPLNRERVKEICAEAGYNTTNIQGRGDFINGIRHGEAAHGIKENT